MNEKKEKPEKVHQSGLPKPPAQQGYHHGDPLVPLDEEMEKEAATGTPDVPLPKDTDEFDKNI